MAVQQLQNNRNNLLRACSVTKTTHRRYLSTRKAGMIGETW